MSKYELSQIDWYGNRNNGKCLNMYYQNYLLKIQSIMPKCST